MEKEPLYRLIARIALAKADGKDGTELWFKVNDLLHEAFDEWSARVVFRTLKGSYRINEKIKELEEENRRLKEENKKLKELLGIS
jgi:hypothetical protein